MSGPDRNLPTDIQQALSVLAQHLLNNNPEVALLFDLSKPVIAARAPGRLDVMGGIADYSGSTVLQLPLAESAVVICQTVPNHNTEETATPTAKPTISIVSVVIEEPDNHLSFQAPLSDFYNDSTGAPLSATEMRAHFSLLPKEQHWVAYIAGVLTVLMTECDVRFDQSLVMYLYSTVPVGKGVSSSAAIEVATMRALTQVIGLELDAHRQAVLCQQVENTVVGAPCGLMDQMTSSMGQSGCLLNLLCQPDIVGKSLRLPENLAVWGIDSGVRHEVSGSDYTSVRVAAFMGYRLMLQQIEIAGTDVPASDIVDRRWYGYLANVSVSEFTQHFAPHLPQSLAGSAFLSEFDDTTDLVTTVDPDTQYAVLPCTAHPVLEHFRVRLFAQLLKQCEGIGASRETANLMGECLLQSHASYSACGLGSQGTDELVARLRQAGSEKGIYGARITGGGSGGTVAVLADSRADDVIRSIAANYTKVSGIGGQVFSGSSDGASVYPDVALVV